MQYGNKEIQAVRAPMGNHYVLAFTSGGEIPAELSGLYTSQGIAYEAVEKFLENKDKPKSKAKSTGE